MVACPRDAELQRLPLPDMTAYGRFALQADGREMSTTVALVRLLSSLIRDPALGSRVVPIVADEARTFGMASLFRQVGIYSPVGQLYEPEDAGTVVAYQESKDGQLLEEGISEAGAISSWVAAATAYSVHDRPMLPCYIFYSMFGFQRIGDLIWAAADQRARGFLIGATAGRTTLGGEGLQHQDGASHLLASTVPNCRAYDPAYAYELAVIVDHGLRRMLQEERDEFYYITAMNEGYPQPSMPPRDGELVKGLYRLGSCRRRWAACASWGRARCYRKSSPRPSCCRPTGACRAMSSAPPAMWSSRARRGKRSGGTACTRNGRKVPATWKDAWRGRSR